VIFSLFSNHYLFSQCSGQTIDPNGFTYGTSMHGQILSPSFAALPTLPMPGSFTFVTSFTAANNHEAIVTHRIGGVVQKKIFATSAPNILPNGSSLNGSYLYNFVPNPAPSGLDFFTFQFQNTTDLNLAGQYVTAWDLIVISLHIGGMNVPNPVPFSNPYQYIAADVDNNVEINVNDIILIRQIILGTAPTWELSGISMSNWRFMPVGHFVNNPTFGNTFTSNPFSAALSPSYPNYLGSFNAAFSPADGGTFWSAVATGIAVKTGDASLDAYNANCFTSLEIEDRDLTSNSTSFSEIIEAGETVKIVLSSPLQSKLSCWQSSFSFDNESIEVLGVNSSKFKGFNKDCYHVQNGNLKMVWFDPQMTSLNQDENCIEVRIKAKKDISAQDIFAEFATDTPNNSIFYDPSGNRTDAQFKYEIVKEEPRNESNLFQIVPSVFQDKFTVYTNSKNTVTSGGITIFDLQGRNVFEKNIELIDGNTSIMDSELSNIPTGIYFAKILLNSGESSVVKIVKQ
jgi:hypothetical protein